MKLIAPLDEHEPQRVRWSRIVSVVYAPPTAAAASSRRGAISSRAARRYQRSSAARGRGRDEQRVAAAVHARPAGLGRQARSAPRYGTAPAAAGEALAHRADLGQARSIHGRSSTTAAAAARGRAREHDLDAVWASTRTRTRRARDERRTV